MPAYRWQAVIDEDMAEPPFLANLGSATTARHGLPLGAKRI